MKKLIVLLFVSLFIVGCSSNGKKQEVFMEAAAACNNVCEANPAIREVSSSAGGGLPLFVVGGMETSCQCVR